MRQYGSSTGDRYLEDRSRCRLLEIWQPNRQVTKVKSNYTLRIQLPESFVLEWTDDDWQTTHTTEATMTCLNIGCGDLEITEQMRSPIEFRLTQCQQDEKQTYRIAIWESFTPKSGS